MNIRSIKGKTIKNTNKIVQSDGSEIFNISFTDQTILKIRSVMLAPEKATFISTLEKINNGALWNK